VTTLHWAARFGQLSLIDKLVDKGADVNAKDNVVCFHLPLLAACPLGLCA
jgi:ankyrin repeat protein